MIFKLIEVNKEYCLEEQIVIKERIIINIIINWMKISKKFLKKSIKFLKKQKSSQNK